MITDPKTLGDMGFNCAMTAAFAVPDVGPIAGAGILGVQTVFDICMGGPAKLPLSQTLATYGELEDEIKGAVDHIDASLWKSAKTTYFTPFENAMDAYNLFIDQAEQGKGPTRTDKIAENVLQGAWDSSFKEAREAMDKLKSPMLTLCHWVDNDPDHEDLTLQMYMASAGLYLCYCKLNMMIYCNQMAREYEFACDKYNANPAGQAAPKPVPDDYMDLLDSDAADNVRYYVDEFIKYADPLVTSLEQRWAARDAGLADRLAKLVQRSGIENGKTVYWWEDTETGETSPSKTDDKGDADNYFAIKQSEVQADAWQDLTDAGSLDDVEQDMIKQSREIVDGWKQCQKEFVQT